MEMTRQLLATLFVLGLLLAAVRLLRRGCGGPFSLRVRRARPRAEIEPLEQVRLSAHHVLHLVRVGDRAILLAAHGSGCSLITSQPWPSRRMPEDPAGGGVR